MPSLQERIKPSKWSWIIAPQPQFQERRIHIDADCFFRWWTPSMPRRGVRLLWVAIFNFHLNSLRIQQTIVVPCIVSGLPDMPTRHCHNLTVYSSYQITIASGLCRAPNWCTWHHS
jgi:hypothetical protein